MSRRISCEIEIGRPREDVFAFLADLENHWKIAGNRVISRHERVDARSSRVLFGPPGLRRWATSRITRTEVPRLIEGIATTARSDGSVRWTLEEPATGRTLVRFEQELRPRPLDDRIAVALSAWWLRRHYRATLVRLRAHLET